jgi:putative transposase
MVYKKVAMIPAHDRKKMIDKADDNLIIEVQCKLLSLAHRIYYYSPGGVSSTDLTIMRMMDEMYLEDPTRGTRRYSVELGASGFAVGRDHVRTLMNVMGIAAIYPKP